MKIHRLLEMTIVLLNKNTVTARELAERFGVTTRTIYRDIDALSASGVPVYATQGAGGGISILEDFTVNRALLSDSEKDSILIALQNLQITRYPEVDSVLEKLGSLFKNPATDWLCVDFMPWGSRPCDEDRFNLIKTAIIQNRILDIEYLNASNVKTCRKIEPMKLIFKAQSWYLRGFCLTRQEIRTFRLTRIKKAVLTDTRFDGKKEHETEDLYSASGSMKPVTHLVLEFQQEALYRLYDDYEEGMLRSNPNGTYTLEIDFPEDEWVYSYILGFGCSVKVISPPHIRAMIKERCEKMMNFYEDPA